MANASSAIPASEFLKLRRSIIDNSELLETFDDRLRDMCAQHPNEAAQVLDELTRSASVTDKEAAAIYSRHLLGSPRHELATVLLRRLLNDPDETVRHTAHDSVMIAVHDGVLTSIDVARLLSPS